MKGILFKEDMFKAVIEGRKTQTRRIFNFKGFCEKVSQVGISAFTPPKHISIRGDWIDDGNNKRFGEWFVKPRYMVGDIVYLKEPYSVFPFSEEEGLLPAYKYHDPAPDVEKGFWKNKMFMPEKYARYYIKITKVDVQRVQDISNYDAHNEGVYFAKSVMGNCYLDYINGGCNILTTAYNSFKSLWKKINGKDSWDSNPWVFVYHFELTEK